MRAGFGHGCKCAACSGGSGGMGGIFSEILDAAGATVGDPGLGDQIASKAQPGFVPVTQNTTQIAQTVAPDVIKAMNSPTPITPTPIPTLYQQIASAAAPQIAQQLKAQGYLFPPGSMGAEYQNPSIFDAFGGQYSSVVKIGALGLAGFLALKLVRAL